MKALRLPGFILAMALLPAQLVSAADRQWTGAGTTWATPANWGGTTPTGTDNAVFSGAFTNSSQPNIGIGTISLGSISITSSVGKNVTISGTGTLHLGGTTINGAAGTGILVDNTTAFALTINPKLILTNSQTWTNNSGNLFTATKVDLGSNALTINGSGSTTVTGVVSGTGALIKSGSGTLTLKDVSSYTGGTIVTAGTLFLSGTLASAATVNSGGTLTGTGNVNGTVSNDGALNVITGTFSLLGTSGNLTNSGTVSVSSSSTLSVGGVAINSSGGTINITGGATMSVNSGLHMTNEGAVAVSAGGKITSGSYTQNAGATTIGALSTLDTTDVTLNAGTVTIDGGGLTATNVAVNGGSLIANSDHGLDSVGTVTLNTGGTLLLGAGTGTNDRIGDGTAIELAGGTIDLNGHSEGDADVAGAGTLTLTASSTLDFGGTGNSLVQFAAIGGDIDFDDNIILQITNWQGTAGVGGGVERLLFSGSASEFTDRYAQNEVTFDGTAGYAAVQFGNYYEVTTPLGFAEVPEPGTIFGGLVLLGMVGYRERGRAAAWWAVGREARCSA